MPRPQREHHGRGAEAAGLAAPELRRLDQVLLGPGPRRRPVNRKDTLNRKYLMQAIDGSLKRFGLDTST
jgi:aryl-alcohol dehydrogenase-like predicted oxidoreductase